MLGSKMDFKMMDVYESTVGQIRKDPVAAEFKIAIFSAAVLSYRHSSCVLPFPPAFVNEDGTKNIKRLEEAFALLPSLEEFTKNLLVLSEEIVSLLHWMLSEKSFEIISCKENSFQELEDKTGKSSFAVQPDYIFEVKYKPSQNSKKFADYALEYDIKYGYHGSRLDNFHSILHNGLQVHMTKTALFGEGIYLCEDLAVTMPYSYSGDIWKHSRLGQQMNCIAVCEIIDHPFVKCKVEDNKSSRSRAKDTQAGDVPEKYFVVTSSEMVRLKYVLAFSKRKAPERLKGRQWLFMQYPVAFILFIYVAFLLLMGLWKSHKIQMFFKRYWVDRSLSDPEY